MLSPTTETFRIFLHVTAAAVWVGGQFALAGVVPSLRRVAPGATKTVATAFARVAWPAFGITVLTGMWGLMAIDIGNTSSAYQATVLLKIAFAIASGVFAAIHAAGKSKLSIALGGALGAVTSLVAMFLGVLLGTGSA
jgi:putative copper export protein